MQLALARLAVTLLECCLRMRTHFQQVATDSSALPACLLIHL